MLLRQWIQPKAANLNAMLCCSLSPIPLEFVSEKFIFLLVLHASSCQLREGMFVQTVDESPGSYSMQKFYLVLHSFNIHIQNPCSLNRPLELWSMTFLSYLFLPLLQRRAFSPISPSNVKGFREVRTASAEGWDREEVTSDDKSNQNTNWGRTW